MIIPDQRAAELPGEPDRRTGHEPGRSVYFATGFSWIRGGGGHADSGRCGEHGDRGLERSAQPRFRRRGAVRAGSASRTGNSAPRYRIINIVAVLQILTIIISRGDVTFLANLYAFGVIWSFAMKGMAVLVLRYTHPGRSRISRATELPHFRRGNSAGPGADHVDAVRHRGGQPVHQERRHHRGRDVLRLLFIVFTISEKITRRGQTTAHHEEMDQFHLAMEGELTPEAVGARPGNILVPVSNHSTLYHLGERAGPRETGAPRCGCAARALVAALRLRRIRTGSRTAFRQHRAAVCFRRRSRWRKSEERASGWR